MNEDQERVAFEAAEIAHWHPSSIPACYLEKEQDGQYVNGFMQAKYHGWMLARAAVQAAPAVPEKLTDSVAFRYRDEKVAAGMANFYSALRPQPPSAGPAERAPLSDDQIQTMWWEAEKQNDSWSQTPYIYLARAVEAAHGIK